jgi:hypothetical protein
MDEKETRLQNEYDITDLKNKAFIKVCKMHLAKDGFLRRMYWLNRSVFNNIRFLPSEMTDMPRPVVVETAFAEDGVILIPASPTSSGQPMAKVQNITTC